MDHKVLQVVSTRVAVPDQHVLMQVADAHGLMLASILQNQMQVNVRQGLM